MSSQVALKKRPFLLWRAFLLDETAYEPVVAHQTPLRRGFMLLLLILLLAGAAKSVGLALELLATPRLDLLEEASYEAATGMTWYAEQVAQTADFAARFGQIHGLGWQIGRLVGGVPSGLGILTIFITQLVLGILGWLLYGSLTHAVARWLGGRASYGQFMGAFALAYVPLLFYIATAIPRLSLAGGVIYLWLLATRYQAIKQSHQLPWVPSLAIVFIPQLILYLLLPTTILFILGIFLP
ncbi:MAG: Yip1 family protein [Chloroflexota bacterium]